MCERVWSVMRQHVTQADIHGSTSDFGALCCVDAYQEPSPPSAKLLKLNGETKEEYMSRLRSIATRLGRLRYFGPDRWTYCFFTYSNEKYEPSVFHSGDWFGTPEDALDIGASYLPPG